MDANGSVPTRADRGRLSRFGILRPLRLRDFSLLWTGMATSLVGDGVFMVALAWQVYELSSAVAPVRAT